MRVIGIYEEHGGQCLVHIVPTIQEASEWLGVKRDTLYKSLHVHGVMKANGFTVETIATTNEDQDDVKVENSELYERRIKKEILKNGNL